VQGQGGGPNTRRGKAASSRNAVKHGLTSDAPVIPEIESFEELERHRAGTVAGFAPEGLEALLPSVLERAFRGEL
jgi:hypothetical protein